MGIFGRRSKGGKGDEPGSGSSSPEPDAPTAGAHGSDERGWDAVTQAAAQHYPDVREFHVAYSPGLRFGSALQGCSALGGSDHWFYVTYGLTELWDKETDDPATSGFGYELTMRVPRLPTDDAPLEWPFGILSLVAQYARSGPQELRLGDRVRLASPVDGDPNGALTTVTVALDPVVTPIETPNGRLAFWQVSGLTDADVEEAKRSSTDTVLRRLASDNPLLITDTGRR
jgi:hypothetical protein